MQKSYMNIQKIRYKNTFSVKFDVDKEVYSYCTVKLIPSADLENAINYGVSSMDDCGEIRVTGRKEGEVIILAVEDNDLACRKKRWNLCSRTATGSISMVRELD